MKKLFFAITLIILTIVPVFAEEIIEETPEYAVFKYFLTPDYDFKQDVLSFGTSVEVLEPERVRKEIGETVNVLNRRYNGQEV